MVKSKRAYYRRKPTESERWQKPKSRSREDILVFIKSTNLVENYTARLLQVFKDDDLYKDYLGEIWLQLCEVKQEKWDDLYNQGAPAITAFVSGLIWRNCLSINSPAYWHIKKPMLNTVHLKDENWDILDEYGEFDWRITEEEQNPWRDKRRNEERRCRRDEEEDYS